MPDQLQQAFRLMHVHAHPDDESSKGAGVTAKYVAEGVDVHVATCTGGERGDILNPKMDRPGILENIHEIRREEMHRARDILGIKQDWLGFVDSGWVEEFMLVKEMAAKDWSLLPEGCFGRMPLEVTTRRLVEIIRSFRPHVLTTYDENGGYPHPDHIMCHRVSVEAFRAAGDPDLFPDAGEPWQPLKLYYSHTFNYPRMIALHEAMTSHGLSSPYEERLQDWKQDPEWDARVTTRVECGEFFGVRDQALLAHATQIDPDGPWFAVPREIEKEAWPTEDYELVTSYVPVPEAEKRQETDLFAGLDVATADDEGKAAVGREITFGKVVTA
ncbi:mycothiol conjugate amidase Mca [Nocardioides sp. CCNWLW239]|uniref:mycothiol conjugate amidase Mca n=1 Tax=Nocardioides sp. CCNWLW239 TaxID=3128902 RepID=UPI00301B6270